MKSGSYLVVIHSSNFPCTGIAQICVGERQTVSGTTGFISAARSYLTDQIHILQYLAIIMN